MAMAIRASTMIELSEPWVMPPIIGIASYLEATR